MKADLTRQQKIDLLKNIKKGQAPIKELLPPRELTDSEFEQLLQLARQQSKPSGKVSPEDFAFLKSIRAAIPFSENVVDELLKTLHETK